MDRGEKITADIIKLVTQEIAEHDGEIDFEAIMRGMASAYTAFAYAFRVKEQAKDLLVTLADQLDDPRTFERMGFPAGADL